MGNRADDQFFSFEKAQILQGIFVPLEIGRGMAQKNLTELCLQDRLCRIACAIQVDAHGPFRADGRVSIVVQEPDFRFYGFDSLRFQSPFQRSVRCSRPKSFLQGKSRCFLETQIEEEIKLFIFYGLRSICFAFIDSRFPIDL